MTTTSRRPARQPEREPSAPQQSYFRWFVSRGRAMSAGAAIFLMTVGAILLFALTPDASPRWINLRVVGLILILAGVLGLTLRRSPGNGMRRWVVPMLPSSEETGGHESDLRREPGDLRDRPTLADELLGEEHDPPLGRDGGRSPSDADPGF